MKTNHPLKVAHQIRIRFDETDAMGIVWHGNYLKYFEDGREAFGRHYNISYLDAKANGFAVPIVKTETNHKLPLKYGDIATVETEYINTEAAKIIFKYTIKNENNEVVCEGKTTQVFTRLKDDAMIIALPEYFKNWKINQGLIDA